MSIIDLRHSLAEALKCGVDSINPDTGLTVDDIAEMFEYPPDDKMGDIALPCFKFSKTLRKAPPMIASELSASLNEAKLVKEAQVAGGYLNIFIDRDAFVKEQTEEITEKGESYGRLTMGEGKTVVLDYSSPNVAKPFHIGHLGTTVIGHSIKMLHEFAGYKCVGVNHLGDWGTQFGKLIVAYRKWGNREEIENGGIDALVALYVKFHEEAEKDTALEDEARAEFTALEAGKEENLELWRWFIDISIEEYKKTYAQLGIEFDSYAGESFYYDKCAPVLDALAKAKITKIDQGATIVDLAEYNMPPCLVLKSDGSTIYATRDIAAALYRKETYDFEKCIYVTSAGQSLHFAQWFKVVELMGYEWYNKLSHIPYGTVSIDGAKLATRTGNVVLLKDLFAQATEKVLGIINEKNPELANKEETAEAVGVGAIVFHYLSNNRIKDINFKLDDVLKFDGNTGPYAQYTYARSSSLLEKAGGIPGNSSYENCTEEEFQLSKTLSKFPEAVTSALESSEPMMITRYILDVCTAFNRFYHECQILSCEDEAVRARRIALTSAVHTVLGSAFGLICMKKTEKI
ncbi:MAG: arginine--tRNA ligase [Ruminococcaceae bacterium]|nr:arginine--tRNA ligase [Oscillospiraceae bacterium]